MQVVSVQLRQRKVAAAKKNFDPLKRILGSWNRLIEIEKCR
jgi:hypothetical protein